MHDTPVRMVAKGVLHGIVPWARARPFLALRLKRRYAFRLSSVPPGSATQMPSRNTPPSPPSIPHTITRVSNDDKYEPTLFRSERRAGTSYTQ